MSLFILGEWDDNESKMKIHQVIPRMSWLLVRLFWFRMFQKYVVRNSHPLVLFYIIGFLTLGVNVLLFGRMAWITYETALIPKVNALAWGITLLSAIQFILFGMFFDMESNKHLQGVSSSKQ